jgi:hypothetical protein
MTPCTHCRRHVRRGERQCPFCALVLATALVVGCDHEVAQQRPVPEATVQPTDTAAIRPDPVVSATLAPSASAAPSATQQRIAQNDSTTSPAPAYGGVPVDGRDLALLGDAGSTAVSPPRATGDVTLGSIAMTGPIANGDAAVARLRPGFRACYNKGLQGDPTMAGKLVVDIKVEPNGDVSGATRTSGAGLSPEVEQCVLRKSRNGAFDAPGPPGVTVHLPLTFTRRN